jgi:hypothetical protein
MPQPNLAVKQWPFGNLVITTPTAVYLVVVLNPSVTVTVYR